MTRSLSSFKAQASLGASLANSLTSGVASVTQKLEAAYAFVTGTAAGQADRVWEDVDRTLTGATSENIDMYDLGSIDIGAGAGKDGAGQALALVEICGLLIVNDSESVGDITVGGEGSGAAWNSLFSGSDAYTLGPIPPGGFVLIVNPANPAWAVADTTNHLLKIASSDDVTYSIAILGRSA